MKLNKFIAGFGGIMALTLTACHDDPEYVPAEPQVTPPAYFNMSDEQVIDLEEDSKDFIVPIYRAEGGAAEEIPVTTTVTAEDGVNANVFNIPATVKFDEGITRADMVVKLSMSDIVPLKHYYFDIKVAGESNPYLLTSVNYDVMYTPWETVKDEAGNEVSTLTNRGLLNSELKLSVLVQEQPSKAGFFRVRHPYFNMPPIQGSTQKYPESDPLWLYINATNARAAYFSDSRGKTPQVFYYTGLEVADMGELILICSYSSYLTQKNLALPGFDKVYTWDQFAGDAGVYENGVINWKNKMIHSFDPTMTAEGALYSNDIWSIKLANAKEVKEWESLGTALVQDGFLSNYFFEPTEAYTVSVERHVDNPNLIRMLNPYMRGVYPDPSGNLTGDYNLEFDITDPDCVLMDIQEMGYVTPAPENDALRCCNKAGAYVNGRLVDENGNQIRMTIAEIKEAGLNDKFENNVLTINHPMIITSKGDVYDLTDEDDPFRPDDWTFIPEIINITPNEQPLVMSLPESKPTLKSGRLMLAPQILAPVRGNLRLAKRTR